MEEINVFLAVALQRHVPLLLLLVTFTTNERVGLSNVVQARKLAYLEAAWYSRATGSSGLLTDLSLGTGEPVTP